MSGNMNVEFSGRTFKTLAIVGELMIFREPEFSKLLLENLTEDIVNNGSPSQHLRTHIEFPLSPLSLEGTKLNIFVSTFVCRMKTFCDSVVDVEAVQRAIFCAQYRRAQARDINFQASKAYFLAVIGIGSLLVGDIPGGEWCSDLYHAMNSAIKPCYQQERENVILGHLAIALFCNLTGQLHEFMRHSGFARVLLNCCKEDATVSHNLEPGYFFVVFVRSYLFTLKNCTWFETLHIFLSQFSLDSKTFAMDFPLMASFADRAADHCEHLDRDCEYAMDVSLKAGGNVSLAVVVFISSKYFQGVLADQKTSTEMKLLGVSELIRFFECAMFSLQLCEEMMAPFCRVFFKLLKVYELLFSKNIEKSKLLLASEVYIWDVALICSYSSPPFLECVLHLLVAALVAMNMDKEYESFKDRFNKALTIQQRAIALPSWSCVTSQLDRWVICDDAVCQGVWAVLLSVCDSLHIIYADI